MHVYLTVDIYDRVYGTSQHVFITCYGLINGNTPYPLTAKTRICKNAKNNIHNECALSLTIHGTVEGYISLSLNPPTVLRHVLLV